MARWYRMQSWLVICLVLGGCGSGKSLADHLSGKSLVDRHSMSRLYTAPEGDLIIFEATVSPDYPLDSAEAEVERESWMSQWLERERMCADGFEIIDRIRIGSAADNPYRHDLRYTLKCSSG